MTVNERIINALSELAPVEPNIYTGSENTYYTFNYRITPMAFSDNEPMWDSYAIQIHLFCPQEFDSVPLRTDTRQRIRAAGLTWPEEIDASEGRTEMGDTSYQHYVFECGILEAVDFSG